MPQAGSGMVPQPTLLDVAEAQATLRKLVNVIGDRVAAIASHLGVVVPTAPAGNTPAPEMPHGAVASMLQTTNLTISVGVVHSTTLLEIARILGMQAEQAPPTQPGTGMLQGGPR